MKNLYDLQKEINKVFTAPYNYNVIAIQDKYSMWRDIKFRTVDIKHENTLDIFSLNMNTNEWVILTDFAYLYKDLQAIVVKFLATTDPEEWFDEKKYNIIIGKETHTDKFKLAYYKNMDCGMLRGYGINNYTIDRNLGEDDYQFTDREIEKLKSKLPENMAEIVELGKVEVKKPKYIVRDDNYTKFKNQFKDNNHDTKNNVRYY